MKLINDIINDILDTVFGNVYIATTSTNVNMFSFLYNLIVLACYIFMFKHFCSFLTNLLTSILKFDGSGFSGNTDSSSGGMFGSNIISQFAGAMGINANNWKKLAGDEKTNGFLSNTIGFRRLGKMAQRFTPFDKQGNLSFGAALKSVPNVKQEFDKLRKNGEFKGLREKDEKKEEFLKARREARREEEQEAKECKELSNLFNANKNNRKQMVHNANNFIISSNMDIKQKNNIKNQEMIRYKNSLARQINKLSKSYQNSLNNKNIEKTAKLEYELKELTRMAVDVNLIDEDKRSYILSGHMLTIDKIKSPMANNVFELDRFNNKKNVDTIINLSKLAQQGLIDASLFTDMNYSMIDNWASGKITKGEYERVIRYMETHDSINKINKNIEYVNGDDLDFNDLMMYEEIYINQDYIDDNEDDNKDDNANKNKNRLKRTVNIIRKRKNTVKKDIVDKTIPVLEEQLDEYKKEIQMGLSDEHIELSPKEAEIAALVGTDFEKSFKSFEEDCNFCAGVENNSNEKEDELTQKEIDTLKHGESMLKVTGLKLKIEEFNKQKYQTQIDILKLESESSTKSDEDKQSIKQQILELTEAVDKSEKISKELKTKQKKINKNMSAINDKKKERTKNKK